MAGSQIGQVTHFFDKICVAVIEVSNTLRVGDSVHFLGRGTDFRQEVKSMQIEHETVEEVGAGQEVAMKVEHRVQKGDRVYKLTSDE
jgi:translation initiation factor IF-2